MQKLILIICFTMLLSCKKKAEESVVFESENITLTYNKSSSLSISKKLNLDLSKPTFLEAENMNLTALSDILKSQYESKSNKNIAIKSIKSFNVDMTVTLKKNKIPEEQIYLELLNCIKVLGLLDYSIQ
jgi:hypothetical protein